MYIVKKSYEFGHVDVCTFDDLACCVSYIMNQNDWYDGYAIYDTRYDIYLEVK